MSHIERTLRYSGLVPLTPAPCTIIGVGAIGSWLAILLAHSGLCSSLTIVDPDTVSAANLGPQCYHPHEIDKPKVEALALRLTQINPSMQVTTLASKVQSVPLSLTEDSHLFIAVDSMEARYYLHSLLESLPDPIPFFDARMGAEVAHIFSFTDPAAYHRTLFPDSEASPLPCSRRATPHCPMIAASLLFRHFTLVRRGETPPPILCLDLPASLLCFPTSLYEDNQEPPITSVEPAEPAAV